MKKLSVLILILVSVNSFGQTIVNRAGASNTVSDERHQAKKNSFLPRYADTTTANLAANIGIDSCGARIFTYSPLAIWYRGCSPKRWIRSLDVENYAQFIDTAQAQSITNISIVNQVDSSISIEICTGDGSCDTVTYVTTIVDASSVQLITDSSISVCSVDTVSGGTVTICDTIVVGKKNTVYFFQNGVGVLSGSNGIIVEHGAAGLVHNTTLNTTDYKYTIYGIPIYDYVTNVYQGQKFSDGAGVISFQSYGSQVGEPDVANTVKLGINYTGKNYPSLATGYMGDKIGYMLNVNGTGNGSYGFGIDNQYSKFGGVFFHTLDTALKDAVTIFGSKPPLLTQAWNMQPYTMDSTRIAVFKHDKQVQFKGYGAGTREAVPNTVSGWDANGNFVEVDTANMGGSVTFIDSTKIIICSFGNYLCDTIYTTEGGLMSIYATNGLTKRNDSTLILGGTFDQNTAIDANFKTFTVNNLQYVSMVSGVSPFARYSSLYIDSTDFTLQHTKDGSQYLITANSALPGLKLSASSPSVTTELLLEPGRVYVNGRFESDKGVSVAAANDLTLGTDGNLFSITGNTQINAITTANWQAGSEIGFIFTGTPTLKNNTAGGAGTATMLLAGRVDYVAAAGDYIAFRYDGTNWYETQRKVAASGGTYTFSNGISETSPGVVKWGSTSTTEDRTWTLNGFKATFTGTSNVVEINKTGASNTIALSVSGSGSSSSGTFTHQSGVGNALFATNQGTGYGLQAWAATGTPLYGRVTTGTNAAINRALLIETIVSGASSNGLGTSIEFSNETSDANANVSASIASTFTDVTVGTRTGDLQLYTTGNAVRTLRLTLDGYGSMKLTPITATAASAITPAEGMIVFTSDTNGTFTSVGFWGYQGGAWVKM